MRKGTDQCLVPLRIADCQVEESPCRGAHLATRPGKDRPTRQPQVHPLDRRVAALGVVAFSLSLLGK